MLLLKFFNRYGECVVINIWWLFDNWFNDWSNLSWADGCKNVSGSSIKNKIGLVISLESSPICE